MTFSYDRAWADVVAMARGHVEILLVLAGLFMLLPDFARTLFVAPPEIAAFDWAAVEIINRYFLANWPALLALNLPVWFGESVILALLLDPQRPTVGTALTGSLPLLPSVIVLNWLSQVMIFAGLFVLIVPGVYLIGRLGAALAAQMAERLTNPLTAIQRSIALTRGNGWRIAGIIFLFAIVAAILTRAVDAIVGIVLALLVPASVLPTVAALASAALTACATLAIVLLGAAIYRQLCGAASTGT